MKCQVKNAQETVGETGSGTHMSVIPIHVLPLIPEVLSSVGQTC